jgi:hypothetical protein
MKQKNIPLIEADRGLQRVDVEMGTKMGMGCCQGAT